MINKEKKRNERKRIKRSECVRVCVESIKMGTGEVKVATVDVESGDNMATLQVSRVHVSSTSTDIAEKNNAANKEMELKNVVPKPLQRYFANKIG